MPEAGLEPGAWPKPGAGLEPVVASLPSAFGPIHLAVCSDAVLGVELLTTGEAFGRSVERRLGVPSQPLRHASPATRRFLDRVMGGIERYLAGDRSGLDLPVTLLGRSRWDVRVLEAVRGIGWGEVASYGRIARAAGSPGAARAAGGAVGRNPIALLIPCHRVIAADGTLGGYGGSWPADRDALLDLKQALLAHEGLVVHRSDR